LDHYALEAAEMPDRSAEMSREAAEQRWLAPFDCVDAWCAAWRSAEMRLGAAEKLRQPLTI